MNENRNKGWHEADNALKFILVVSEIKVIFNKFKTSKYFWVNKIWTSQGAALLEYLILYVKHPRWIMCNKVEHSCI